MNDANKNILIPREAIFGNPTRIMPSVSDDGNYLAYIAPHEEVLNIFVAKYNNIADSHVVSNDRNRGIRNYLWCYDNEHIFYTQDNNGDENTQIYIVNVKTAENFALTNNPNAKYSIVALSRKYINKVIYQSNERNPSYFDLYEMDIKTSETRMIFENNEFSGFSVDDDLNLRFLSKSKEDGGNEIFIYEKNEYRVFMDVPKEDVLTTGIVGFKQNNNIIYVMDSRNNNTAKLVAYNLEDNTQEEIFHSEFSDIGNIIFHPSRKDIDAIIIDYLKQEIHPQNEEMANDINFLQKNESGQLNIISRCGNNDKWVVAYLRDDFPVIYHLYERKEKKLTKLFTQRPELEKYELTHMHPIIIKSRDNLDLISYLSLPIRSLKNKTDLKPIKAVPMVLLVHGGPSVRDHWGLNMMHQWLANRGYAVLSVNYRGSTGFGKKFFNAGFGEWAAKMHDDLIDAVNYAISNNIADKDKICIMGGSYGGYAALVGLTFTPDVFACGVDIVGPSNLITLLNTIPSYWKSARKFLENLTGGNPDTEEGRSILSKKSPINYIDNITKPLLIGQGANDPRVKQSESDQIVAAMKEKNIPVTYILYPDEGHGFAKPHNSISFYAIAENFLKNILNGDAEIYIPDGKTSMQIIEGKDLI